MQMRWDWLWAFLIFLMMYMWLNAEIERQLANQRAEIAIKALKYNYERASRNSEEQRSF